MKKLRLHPYLQALMVFVLLFISILLLKFSIHRTIENHEKETGKTILENVGEELGKAKKAFDNAYNDTTKNE